MNSLPDYEDDVKNVQVQPTQSHQHNQAASQQDQPPPIPQAVSSSDEHQNNNIDNNDQSIMNEDRHCLIVNFHRNRIQLNSILGGMYIFCGNFFFFLD